MSKKLTVEEFKEKLYQKRGEEITFDELTYIDTKTIAWFIDKDYGGWWATPNNILNGRSHKNRKQEKTKKTCLEKYGESCVLNLPANKEERTNKRKLSIDQVKKRLFDMHGDQLSLDETTYVNINTICRLTDKDYGEWWVKLNNVFENSRVHPATAAERRDKTCLERYGTTNPAQCKEVKEKTRQTNLKNLGVEYNFQTKEFREKSEKTSIEKYGVDNAMKNKDIHIKASRSANQIIDLLHWKDNSQVSCRGSYEVAVVNYLNENKIDYKWQAKTFLMPDGKTYTPDLYLSDKDLWVEIKGYFWGDAEEKWDWFHKECPNSELWDKKALKEKKILK